MYTFSNKLKTFSFVLMLLGLVGIAYGFLNAPKTTEDVEQILTEQHHGAHHEITHADSHDTHDELAVAKHQEHLEHVLHQLQNKTWAAVYTACIFFMFIALGIFTFNKLQYAGSAGWSSVLYRVMEGLSAYLLPGSILFFLLLLASSVFHLNHMFIWMDDTIVAEDSIIQAKSGFLNIPFFLIRAVVFLGGWNLFRYLSRKNS